ncbi:ABC transporter permease [Streptomyces sp. GQFP]|uniref:ABC transporter permease n=1 Tax=Streptomyces sp. GQFP TaxID=2907545 RepID=UPI001F39CD09|nr:ABC transporter permease [Streptomyces sp. GQFP]UIX29192.1 ABC transporter permease [Streptomyces sp. GQFP]
MSQIDDTTVAGAQVALDPAPTGTPGDTAPAPAQPRRRYLGPLQRLTTYGALVPALLFLLLALVGPWITPWSPTEAVASPHIKPNGSHWFGTDSSGLDIFSRVLAAARNDIQIALTTAVIATVVGISLGLLIGMNESKGRLLGPSARFMARALDLMQAIPTVVIGLVLVAFFGASVRTLIISLAVILFPIQARLVRTEVLRVRSEAYLDAARMAGESEFRLTVRHVLPNSSWPALENSTVLFSVAILITSALGFLGVGLQPPTPEWGSMIAGGASDAAVGRWWSGLFPALAMTLCVVAYSNAGHRLIGRRH